MNIRIPYNPHPKQLEVHNSTRRFRVIAAGRRAGKTTLALHELVRHALKTPNGRSWYVAPTYRQAKSVVWNDPSDGIFGVDDLGRRKFLPKELIKQVKVSELLIELINGHVIEFKGAENKDKLRGAGIGFLILDEFGHMHPDVWTSILRPMLAHTMGKAIFIGTPAQNGSPHFQDLHKLGQENKDTDFRSWIFYTKDNPHIPPEEVESARRTLPPDEFKREWEADFSVAEGLVYDNFNHALHVIPSYEPKDGELVVGSIDPGIYHETGVLLTAWKKDGSCKIFKEYYQKGFIAQVNAERILALAKPYNVKYWVIDRASAKADPGSGVSVYDLYREFFNAHSGGPIYLAPNNPGSVLKGINETKRLLQPVNGVPLMQVTEECVFFINEILHYSWHEPEFRVKPLDGQEKPRKYKDHLMDCIKNIVLTKPWMNRGGGIKFYNRMNFGFGY